MSLRPTYTFSIVHKSSCITLGLRYWFPLFSYNTDGVFVSLSHDNSDGDHGLLLKQDMLGKHINSLPTPADTNLSLSQEKGPLFLWMVSPLLMLSLLIHIPSGPQPFSLLKGLLSLPKNKADVELFVQMPGPQVHQRAYSHQTEITLKDSKHNSHLSMNSISKRGS